MSDTFEVRFSEFLDSDACDMAEEALFSLLRMAFAAGWEAAGGAATVKPWKAPPAIL